MDFEIVGEIREKETIAIGRNIRNLKRLQKQYGRGRWRKLKGITTVRLKGYNMDSRSILVRGARNWQKRIQAEIFTA